MWADVFKLAQRVSTAVGTEIDYFSFSEDGSVYFSPAATWLIILSLTLPIFVSIVIGSIVFLGLKSKVEELRSNFFLSSIEGTRLNSMEIFRGLSLNAFAFRSHVSKLASIAPASANLQTRHTMNVLKFFALFEIGSKVPQDGCKYQVWYLKVLKTTSSLLDTINNGLRQLFICLTEFAPALEGYTPLILSDPVQKSYLSLFFKKVDTKFARRLVFPNHVLDKLKCDPKSELLNLLKVRSEGGSNVKNAASRNKEFKCTVKVLEHKGIQKEVQEGCKGLHDVATAAVFFCVKLDPNHDHELSAATLAEFIHVGVGVQLTSKSSHMKDRPFPIDGERRFVISEIIFSSPCVAHVAIECLNPTAFVDLHSFRPNMELTMHFDDPYVIDDDTIEWFKNKELLESQNLRMQIGQVINDDLNDLKLVSKSRKEHRPKNAVWCKNDFELKFSPYEHRALLVCCAIFFDASEAYRNIVSATGVEFFMDMRTSHVTCHMSHVTRHTSHIPH